MTNTFWVIVLAMGLLRELLNPTIGDYLVVPAENGLLIFDERNYEVVGL